MPVNITGFVPNQGPAGTSVTISMTGMPAAAATSNTSVMLGPTAMLEVTAVNVAAGTVDVKIEDNAETAQFTVIFTTPGDPYAISTNEFKVTQPGPGPGGPTIDQLTPRSGPVGTQISLRGTELSKITRVEFGNSHEIAEFQKTETSLHFKVPHSCEPASYNIICYTQSDQRVLCPFRFEVS